MGLSRFLDIAVDPRLEFELKHEAERTFQESLLGIQRLAQLSPAGLQRWLAWIDGTRSTDPAECARLWSVWMAPGHEHQGVPHEKTAPQHWCLAAFWHRNAVALKTALDAGYRPWEQQHTGWRRHWGSDTDVGSVTGWLEGLTQHHADQVAFFLSQAPDGSRVKVGALDLWNQEASPVALALRHGKWSLAEDIWNNTGDGERARAAQEGLWALCGWALQARGQKDKQESLAWIQRLLDAGASWEQGLPVSEILHQHLMPAKAEEDWRRWCYQQGWVREDQPAPQPTGDIWQQLHYPLTHLLAAHPIPKNEHPTLKALWASAAPALAKARDAWGRPAWATHVRSVYGPSWQLDDHASNAGKAWRLALWKGQTATQQARAWTKLTKDVTRLLHEKNSHDSSPSLLRQLVVLRPTHPDVPVWSWEQARAALVTFAEQQPGAPQRELWKGALDWFGQLLGPEDHACWTAQAEAFWTSTDKDWASGGAVRDGVSVMHWHVNLWPLTAEPPRPTARAVRL